MDLRSDESSGVFLLLTINRSKLGELCYIRGVNNVNSYELQY